MSARIIDRGRGPELQGTRVTVYRILDYVREGSTPERMAAELDLTDEQVKAALDFIAANRAEADEEYEKILRRVRQPNPDWVEAGLAKSPEELKRRIAACRRQDLAHADRIRQ